MDGCARTIDWLRGRVAPLTIWQICEADRGQDAEAHYAGMVALLDRGWVNGAPTHYPREVLELERWSEPRGEGSHLRRMLVCGLLVCCMGYERKDAYFIEGGIIALAHLAESAMALGGEAPGVALELLRWFAERHGRPTVYPFACFATARLRLHMGLAGAAELKAWVDAEEARAAEALGPGELHGSGWLTRLSIYASGEEDAAKWAWAS